jgi:hypothetical protein
VTAYEVCDGGNIAYGAAHACFDHAPSRRLAHEKSAAHVDPHHLVEAVEGNYEFKELQSELRPGVRTDGVITFGQVDPSQPMEVRFEWYSDNYDITTHPIVFQVEP